MLLDLSNKLAFRNVHVTVKLAVKLDETRSMRRSLLGRPVSLKRWERFRLPSPKLAGSVIRISKGDHFVTDVQRLSEAVLQGR